MGKGRLEAFSDGVIAIIITIMVLELKVPHSDDLAVLQKLLPVFLSYVLSFVNLGIYWNNHHHLLQAVRQVNGGILWANMHLLFWLSLFPFATAWMGENNFSPRTVGFYGIVSLLSGIAYFILTRTLVSHHGRESVLSTAIGSDFKGKISLGFYALGILLSFFMPPLSCALYVLVAIIWLVPDRRIEKTLIP
jgi:uncharacterized membrane protein